MFVELDKHERIIACVPTYSEHGVYMVEVVIINHTKGTYRIELYIDEQLSSTIMAQFKMAMCSHYEFMKNFIAKKQKGENNENR